MLAAVAITGTGIISPIGNKASTVWKNWLNNYTKVDYKWTNPIESIVTKIKEIYES